MIIFAGNWSGTDPWRNMSVRYHAATVNGLSGADANEDRWLAIDALRNLPGLKFAANTGNASENMSFDTLGLSGVPAITPDAFVNSSRVYQGHATRLDAAIDPILANNSSNSRLIEAINVNVEIDNAVQALWHGGLDLTETAFNEAWFVDNDTGANPSPGTNAQSKRIRAEVGYWDEQEFGWGLGYDPVSNTFQTPPTFEHVVLALTRMHSFCADHVKDSGLIASQWWKSRGLFPFFRSGWWSGVRPASSCQVGSVSPSCRPIAAFHTSAGHRIEEWNGSAMIPSTGSPNVEATNAWVSGGWAQRAEECHMEMYANCPGMADGADIVPVQFYAFPGSESSVVEQLGSGGSGFQVLNYRQDAKFWYLPTDKMVDSLKTAARQVWQGASAQYGSKAALGLKWFADVTTREFYGSMCPIDVYKEVLDHAFEPGEGSIAPKHIAFWATAGYLSYVFPQDGASSVLGDSLNAARATVVDRFAGRTSVPVEWSIGTTQSPNQGGLEWRAAVAAMLDEDTYERVLVAKRCIERAQVKHAARQSTLDAGGIVIGSS